MSLIEWVFSFFPSGDHPLSSVYNRENKYRKLAESLIPRSITRHQDRVKSVSWYLDLDISASMGLKVGELRWVYRPFLKGNEWHGDTLSIPYDRGCCMFLYDYEKGEENVRVWLADAFSTRLDTIIALAETLAKIDEEKAKRLQPYLRLKGMQNVATKSD